MSTLAFAAGLEIQPSKEVTHPAPAKARPPPVNIELGDVAHSYEGAKQPWAGSTTPAGAETPYVAPTQHNTGAQTPRTPHELESSTTPRHGNVTGVVPGWSYPKMNRWRVLCACITYFGNGMNDSAPGPLIPYIEKNYSIGYAIVSLIFVTNAAGFIIAAFMTDTILAKLGRARTLMASETIMSLGCVILACTPPFPAVVIAYFFLGLGCALNLAMNNVFCANLNNSTVILGAAHGAYGIGGIVAPILATAMVSNGIPWSRFFIIALGIRILCFLMAGYVWKGYEDEPTSQFSNSLELIASRQRAAELGEPTKWQLLKKAISNRTTVIGALFIFAYQGAEVSISGWIISYLISYRGGDPAHVGYVSSGFWGGITVGRFVLSHAASKVGEKRFVYMLAAGAIAFELLIWFIPNVIGDAVAVAVVGLLSGPIYPTAQAIFSRLLPAQIQMSSVSFISSAGSSGGAIAPLATGLLAQAVGTFVLHPIVIGLFAAMCGCWFSLPSMVKRTE